MIKHDDSSITFTKLECIKIANALNAYDQVAQELKNTRRRQGMSIKPEHSLVGSLYDELFKQYMEEWRSNR